MSLLRRVTRVTRRPARAGAEVVAEFARYLRIETVGGTLLLIATAVALGWANSRWGDAYAALRDTPIGPGALHLDLTVGQWASDALLALFFFVASLELKRELVVGELADRRAAALPVVAAVGGMLVPVVLALVVSAGAPDAGRAWAVPVATDIAFALGVLALTGSRLPTSARIFLLSLAVVDDLGAITLIAVLFTGELALLGLAATAALAALYATLQARRVRSSWLYVPVAVATWAAVHESGVHATIAGVLLGLLTRVRPDEGEHEGPALRLEHRLQPWSAGVAVPVFALFAAGVPLDAAALAGVAGDRVSLGIIAGLLVGKVVGILGFSFVAVRLGLASRPPGLDWGSIAVVATLGGVGFTVSLLIAELALDGPAVLRAKAAVLIASALAALLAAALAHVVGRRLDEGEVAQPHVGP